MAGIAKDGTTPQQRAARRARDQLTPLLGAPADSGTAITSIHEIYTSEHATYTVVGQPNATGDWNLVFMPSSGEKADWWYSGRVKAHQVRATITRVIAEKIEAATP